MKKTLLCLSLVMAAMACTAQEYEWQWAKRGGGTDKSLFELPPAYDIDVEQVVDIKIDSDNNYYFLAFITENNTEFDGTPITVYNATSEQSGYTDLVLIATDCEGTLRWTQAIGGGNQDLGYKIELDNDGGLYVDAVVLNTSNAEGFLPPHFSADDMQPEVGENNGQIEEGFKTLALLKYNTNDGSFAWRVMPQGDVNGSSRLGTINHVIDSENNLHVLMGFRQGSHLDGEAVVPDTFAVNMKYYIAKYDTDGNRLNVLPLSLEGRLDGSNTHFTYDENLQRYYLSGSRNIGGGSDLVDLSFNAVPFTQQAYILAFTEDGEELWRKEPVAVSQFRDDRINGFEIDTDSNIYLTGKYYIDYNAPGVSMGDYQFPTNNSGNVVYIMKLNQDGVPQWIRTPDGYTTANNGIFTGRHVAYDLAINDDQIAVATQICNEIWGDFTFNRPVNHRSDPAVMLLDKATGEPVAVHDVMGSFGVDDAFTAIAVDNEGSYIMGGYFVTKLFTADDDNVPTLDKVLNQGAYTDFYIAKLATGACGEISGNDAFEKSGTKLYPNPSKRLLNIRTDEQLNSYEVLSIQGQVLLKGDLGTHPAINVESLSSGVYIINLTTADSRIISQKIIKE